MIRTAIRSVGQLLLLLVTFGLVLGLVMGAGALLLPGVSSRPEPGDAALPALDELEGAAAVMAAGDPVRSLVLDRLRESELTDDGALRFLFQGPDARLFVTAPARVGEAITGDAVDVLLVLERTNYFPKDCTLELATLEPTERAFDSVNGWMAGPRAAGTLTCRVEGSGREPFPVEVVFRLEQIPS